MQTLNKTGLVPPTRPRHPLTPKRDQQPSNHEKGVSNPQTKKTLRLVKKVMGLGTANLIFNDIRSLSGKCDVRCQSLE